MQLKKYIKWIKEQDNIELIKKLNYIGVPFFIVFIIIITYSISKAYSIATILTLFIYVVLNLLLYGVTMFINLRR